MFDELFYRAYHGGLLANERRVATNWEGIEVRTVRSKQVPVFCRRTLVGTSLQSHIVQHYAVAPHGFSNIKICLDGG